MPVTLYSVGTQAATVPTEHFLTSPNIPGTFTLHIDTVNMIAGDALVVRAYQMVLTGGTSRVAYIQSYSGAQSVDDLIKISVPISNELSDTNALRFSLNQTTGTSRNFPWKVLLYN